MKCFDINNSDPIGLESTKLNCPIYADDVLLISESKNDLQSYLDSIATYCECWKLKINVDKTKIMIFSKGKIKTDKLIFTINNTQIEVVDKYKYLGIMLNFNGNLKHVAEHMYNKSIKAIFSLKAKIMNYDNINNKLLLKLFDCLIRPILTYGSEIWIYDFNVKESVLEKLPFEKLHNKFCNYFLGVHRRLSKFASRLELGRERILSFITSLALKFNERLSELPANCFLREVYNEEGYKSWCSFINQSVKKLSVSSNSMYGHQTSQYILSRYANDITTEPKSMRSHEHGNKLCTFSYLCNEFCFQTYLSFGLSKRLPKN